MRSRLALRYQAFDKSGVVQTEWGLEAGNLKSAVHAHRSLQCDKNVYLFDESRRQVGRESPRAAEQGWDF
jgi:hypothetical protein